VPFYSVRAILAGLDPGLHQDLATALRALAIEVISSERTDADLVFCGTPAVESEHRSHPTLPLIAVSGRQDVAEWLDAMDAGATDYCAAPFELVHLDWILRSSARSSVHRAV
jgi:DNA-binding NtrC family response regulator